MKELKIWQKAKNNPLYEEIQNILYWKYHNKITGEKWLELVVSEKLKRIVLEENHALLIVVH
jgi:hypothetical protein